MERVEQGVRMRTIDVEGLFNVRSIAGPAPWLIRAGAPKGLTFTGAATLRGLGLSTILDLREPSERSGEPADRPPHGFAVRSVPLYGTPPPQTGRLEDIYERLLRERGTALAEAVAVIASAERSVLVHCTAGKDRTGLVVALARLAAGAHREDVVADYEMSGIAVRPLRRDHAHAMAVGIPAAERDEVLRLHLDSPAEALWHALGVVDESGGTAVYLRTHGMGERELTALRRKGAA